MTKEETYRLITDLKFSPETFEHTTIILCYLLIAIYYITDLLLLKLKAQPDSVLEISCSSCCFKFYASLYLKKKIGACNIFYQLLAKISLFS